MNGFEPEQHLLATDQLLALDQWAIERANQLQDELKAAYDKYEFHVIYQKVLTFCSIEMGSFYLDVIKDRQYTTQPDSIARRSAQSAMYHIMEAFARWISPILSFTADELWQYIPGERGESIFLETWYDFPTVASNDVFNLDYWDEVLQVRVAVSKQLEQLRTSGEIGSSLDSEVDLFCGQEIYDRLAKLEDELRFVLITSGARIHRETERTENDHHVTLSNGDEIWIRVQASEHAKCVRCWHHQESVGQNQEHPELCSRCVDNVEGEGEARQYA